MENNNEINKIDIPEIPKEEKSSWGAIIGLVIILALIIAGSIYFFIQAGGKIEKAEQKPDINIEEDLESLRNLSTSGSIESIEKDLEETNLDNLDSELDDIEKELDAIEQNF